MGLYSFPFVLFPKPKSKSCEIGIPYFCTCRDQTRKVVLLVSLPSHRHSTVITYIAMLSTSTCSINFAILIS